MLPSTDVQGAGKRSPTAQCSKATSITLISHGRPKLSQTITTEIAPAFNRPSSGSAGCPAAPLARAVHTHRHRRRRSSRYADPAPMLPPALGTVRSAHPNLALLDGDPVATIPQRELAGVSTNVPLDAPACEPSRTSNPKPTDHLPSTAETMDFGGPSTRSRRDGCPSTPHRSDEDQKDTRSSRQRRRTQTDGVATADRSGRARNGISQRRAQAPTAADLRPSTQDVNPEASGRVVLERTPASHALCHPPDVLNVAH